MKTILTLLILSTFIVDANNAQIMDTDTQKKISKDLELLDSIKQNIQS